MSGNDSCKDLMLDDDKNSWVLDDMHTVIPSNSFLERLQCAIQNVMNDGNDMVSTNVDTLLLIASKPVPGLNFFLANDERFIRTMLRLLQHPSHELRALDLMEAVTSDEDVARVRLQEELIPLFSTWVSMNDPVGRHNLRRRSAVICLGNLTCYPTKRPTSAISHPDRFIKALFEIHRENDAIVAAGAVTGGANDDVDAVNNALLNLLTCFQTYRMNWHNLTIDSHKSSVSQADYLNLVICLTRGNCINQKQLGLNFLNLALNSDIIPLPAEQVRAICDFAVELVEEACDEDKSLILHWSSPIMHTSMKKLRQPTDRLQAFIARSLGVELDDSLVGVGVGLLGTWVRMGSNAPERKVIFPPKTVRSLLTVLLQDRFANPIRLDILQLLQQQDATSAEGSARFRQENGACIAPVVWSIVRDIDRGSLDNPETWLLRTVAMNLLQDTCSLSSMQLHVVSVLETMCAARSVLRLGVHSMLSMLPTELIRRLRAYLS